MTKVLILPDGAGVRNFLLGGFLEAISATDKLAVLHLLSDAYLEETGFLDFPNVEWYPLRPYKETPFTLISRHTMSYGHMYWADTQAMQRNRSRRKQGSLATQAAYRTAKIAGRALAFPKGVQFAQSVYLRVVRNSSEYRHYLDLFKQIKPTVIFSSNQWTPIVVAPFLAARTLGIPTVTFIFSWDNLTSKGRIIAPFDHYMVWSDLMRQELLQYHSEIKPSHIHIVGTPQFDPYADESLRWTREVFFERIGADASRPLICYSGGAPGTHPDEARYVEILMEHVSNGTVRNDPQVLLRPAPVDTTGRFDYLCEKYPQLIYRPPQWKSTLMPFPEDVEFLANLTFHADMNINIASTMTLDFAIHDKPVVNPAFDVSDPLPHGKPIWEFYYQFEHYRPVIELQAARFPRSPEAMVEDINRYLEDSSIDRDGRLNLVKLEVGDPSQKSSQRLLHILQELSL